VDRSLEEHVRRPERAAPARRVEREPRPHPLEAREALVEEDGDLPPPRRHDRVARRLEGRDQQVRRSGHGQHDIRIPRRSDSDNERPRD
jgi:hypothetical protein